MTAQNVIYITVFESWYGGAETNDLCVFSDKSEAIQNFKRISTEKNLDGYILKFVNNVRVAWMDETGVEQVINS